MIVIIKMIKIVRNFKKIENNHDKRHDVIYVLLKITPRKNQ